jgi:hypothetical protein
LPLWAFIAFIWHTKKIIERGQTMQKSITDGFTAERCIFQCIQGYKVKQWNGGACVCSQFIPAEAFWGFCTATGIDEKIIVFL